MAAHFAKPLLAAVIESPREGSLLASRTQPCVVGTDVESAVGQRKKGGAALSRLGMDRSLVQMLSTTKLYRGLTKSSVDYLAVFKGGSLALDVPTSSVKIKNDLRSSGGRVK